MLCLLKFLLESSYKNTEKYLLIWIKNKNKCKWDRNLAGLKLNLLGIIMQFYSKLGYLPGLAQGTRLWPLGKETVSTYHSEVKYSSWDKD